MRTTRRRLKFVLYKAFDGWRWRLVAANGKIVADSGEAYKRKAAVIKACDNLIDNVGSASVIDETGKELQ